MKQNKYPANPSIVIINGKPCTGKTSIAETLSKEFSLPLFSKDMLKETMFDTLGYDDRERSKQYGVASYAILFHLIEQQVRAGNSLVVESNFSSKYDTPQFEKMQRTYGVGLLQIMCETDSDVLFERFAHRARSSQRHPGHNDLESLEEWRGTLTSGPLEPLAVSGEVVKLDTTDFEELDLSPARQALTRLSLVN